MGDPFFQHRTNSVSAMVSKIETKCHPGLMLDKLLSEVPKEMKNARGLLDSVVKTQGDAKALAALNTRRSKTLKGLGAKTWEQKLITPMALHLARAALLENANVCLHRTYGFAYLPSSGLKGMARAWAITVWLAEQQDKVAAWKSILRVFGFGNTPEYQTLLKQYPVLKIENRTECSGAVMFHDAWPKTWPKLEVDILTSHHSDYYSKNGATPPGDWEAPVPVNFLVVAKGTDFQFALSEVQGLGDSKDVELAREFLSGALSRRGAGGKTSSGYGYFAELAGTTPSLNEHEKAATFECELELVTPAFLAGADQDSAEGCDLRGATLRGQLRWWWRTLHAGYMDPKMLHLLESAIWGNASMGGAVSLWIEASGDNPKAVLSPFKKLDKKNNGKTYLELDKAFATKNRIVQSNKQNVIPGLVYISYGMDEYDNKQSLRKQRYCLQAPANWLLTMTFRKTELLELSKEIPMEVVREQALASMKLLSEFGGVGSKSRKGFGSVNVYDQKEKFSSVEFVKTINNLYNVLGIEKNVTYKTESIAYRNKHVTKRTVEINAISSWEVMDKIGIVMRNYATSMKHEPEKLRLGLPRKIHGPFENPLHHQNAAKHQSPIELESLKAQVNKGRFEGRHPAPLFFHVSSLGSSKYKIQMAFFADPMLQPLGKHKDLEKSFEFAKKTLEFYETEFQKIK